MCDAGRGAVENHTRRHVRSQIESAESFDLGWMLWNAKSNVTVEALRLE